MSRLTERLGLAVFMVLTGALATNMFLLQPPARRTMTGPEDRMGSYRVESPTASTAEPSKTTPATPSPTASTASELPVTPAVAQATLPPETAAATPPSSTSSSSPSSSVTVVAPTEQNPLKVAPPPETAKAEPPKTPASPELVKALQRELRAKNYETGAEDGTVSLVTRAAIMAYESDQNLPLSGEATDALLQHIILGEIGGSTSTASSSASDLKPSAADVVKEVQADLKRAGYDPGSEDGRLSDATIRAIREFESASNMQAKGRISGELVAKLKAAPAKTAAR